MADACAQSDNIEEVRNLQTATFQKQGPQWSRSWYSIKKLRSLPTPSDGYITLFGRQRVFLVNLNQYSAYTTLIQ